MVLREVVDVTPIRRGCPRLCLGLKELLNQVALFKPRRPQGVDIETVVLHAGTEPDSLHRSGLTHGSGDIGQIIGRLKADTRKIRMTAQLRRFEMHCRLQHKGAPPWNSQNRLDLST